MCPASLIIGREVFFPDWNSFRIAVRKIEPGVHNRLKGLTGQLHISLFGSSAGFAMVTFRASAGNISPLVFTAAVTGDDMIYRKQRVLFIAILTGVIISTEYPDSGEFVLVARLTNHIVKPDNGRQRDFLRDGTDKSHSIFNHFSLAFVYQNNGAPYLTDAQRLKTVIKHQYRQSFLHILDRHMLKY
jgi:hypothetical protein